MPGFPRAKRTRPELLKVIAGSLKDHWRIDRCRIVEGSLKDHGRIIAGIIAESSQDKQVHVQGGGKEGEKGNG